jgi:immunoglobulin-binding protein 1
MNRPLQNLQTLFASAKVQKKALEETETNSPSYRDQLQDVISRFEECQRLIGQLCLFSTNESVEDIATGDLQYVHFWSSSWKKNLDIHVLKK